MGSIKLLGSSGGTTFEAKAQHGTHGGTPIKTLNKDTVYHWWFEYHRGSGSDGIFKFWSTNTTNRADDADPSIVTDGTSNYDSGAFRMRFTGGMDAIIDQVIIKTTEFTTVCD